MRTSSEGFEYAIKKDVRNNPIVREIDEERQRQLWRTAGISAVLVLVVLFSAWQTLELVLHGYEVDFYWPQARLVVEIDTYTYHRSWAQRQRDLERDADLKVRGEEVLRFTRERIERAADVVVAQVAALLAVEGTSAAAV